jgi:hypothetical protein
MRIGVILLAAAVLGGCASGPSGPTDRERLFESCRARGGFLVPLGKVRSTTNEAANYACEVGGGSP